MAVTKLPYQDFEEYMGGGYPYGQYYNEDNPGRFDDEFPNPFGEDLFDRVKANPRRGSNAGKKDAFQNLLNNATGQQIAQMGVAGPANVIPSQMPNAMGGMPTHGITANLGTIPGTAIGNMAGEQIARGKGGFNIMNPFTYGNLKEAVDKTRAGDENVEYSNTPAGQIGAAANERNRLMKEMLEGY